jgi:hypothetical protein
MVPLVVIADRDPVGVARRQLVSPGRAGAHCRTAVTCRVSGGIGGYRRQRAREPAGLCSGWRTAAPDAAGRGDRGGLAAGVALVITVTDLSSGARSAQGKMLGSL